jgi:hypothetical protein
MHVVLRLLNICWRTAFSVYQSYGVYWWGTGLAAIVGGNALARANIIAWANLVICCISILLALVFIVWSLFKGPKILLWEVSLGYLAAAAPLSWALHQLSGEHYFVGAPGVSDVDAFNYWVEVVLNSPALLFPRFIPIELSPLQAAEGWPAHHATFVQACVVGLLPANLWGYLTKE